MTQENQGGGIAAAPNNSAANNSPSQPANKPIPQDQPASLPTFTSLGANGGAGAGGDAGKPHITIASDNPTGPNQASNLPASEMTPAHKVKLALSLGAVLIELRSRVKEAQLRGPENAVSRDNPSDGYWLASTWRGLFSRAVNLHTQLLGDMPVALARYNITDDRPAYLNSSFDFIDIGLEHTNIKFGLAEKLRQALNFLTCLYQRLDRTDDVLKQIFESDKPLITLAQAQPGQPAPDYYNYMIKDLTQLVEALITAWDNYIRERLFAESNVLLEARYGYAAGRALSELSWNVTVKTAPYRVPKIKEQYAGPEGELGNEVYQIWLETFKPEAVTYLQRQLMVLTNILQYDYETRNNIKPDTSPESELNQNGLVDPRSPKAGINAVIQSLDYWQKTILEMSEHGIMQRSNQPATGTGSPTTGPNPQPPSFSQTLRLHPSWDFDLLLDLRLALNEQQGNWFSLVAEREDLTSFRVVNVAGDLIQNYSRQITRLATQNLQAAFKEIQQEFDQLAEVGKEAAAEVAKVGVGVINGIFRNRVVLVALTIFAVLLVAVIAILAAGGVLNTAGVITSLVAPLLGVLGIQPGLNRAVRDGQAQISSTELTHTAIIDSTSQVSQQKMGESANIGAMVLTAAGQLRDYLEAAFSKGFIQLQRELGLISATLAATSPLIEFVVRNCDPNNDLEFLSKIAWNDEVKRSQRDRIVLAAFGPVGAFLISSEQDTGSTEAKGKAESLSVTQAQVAAANPSLAKSL